jgi:Mg2+-importing ATPase
MTVIATIFTPIVLNNVEGFNFVMLPMNYYFYLLGLVVLYGIIAQVVKKIYIKKYGEWL